MSPSCTLMPDEFSVPKPVVPLLRKRSQCLISPAITPPPVRAPQLEPDLVASAVEHRRCQPGCDEEIGEALHVRGGLGGGLAERKVVAVDVTDHAGRLDLGGGIDDAADGALGADFAPLPSA